MYFWGMRFLKSSTLILVIMSHQVYNLAVLTYWLTNHTYIAKNLCINKEKPEMHCDGKCYLKQKMSTNPDNKQEDEKTSIKLKISTEVYNFLPLQNIVFASMPLILSAKPIGKSTKRGTLIPWDIFKPPTFFA